ncbi:MAG: hypothetical protein QM756_19845 [Polyangiaceae bacterium]
MKTPSSKPARKVAPHRVSTRASAATAPQRGEHHATADVDDDVDSDDLDSGVVAKSAFIASEAEAEMLADLGLTPSPEELGSRAMKEALQEGSPGKLEVSPLQRVDGGPLGAYANPDDAHMSGELSRVDLTQNVVDEGSLFDQPRSEGGTRRPDIRTNEVDATLERNERAARWRKRHARK